MIRTTLICLGFALAAGVANAQASFDAVDTNHDGMLDVPEMEAMFGHDATMMYFQSYDANGDHMVTPTEITEHMSMMSDNMDSSMDSSMDSNMDDSMASH